MGTDVDNGAAAGADVLDGFLRGVEEAQNVEAKLLFKVLDGNDFKGRELEDAGVIDEEIEPADAFRCAGDGGDLSGQGLGPWRSSLLLQFVN